MLHDVRLATAHDRDQAVATLSRAFEHDPVSRWVLRDDARRPRAREEFFRAHFDYYQRHALVFCAPDAGFALWAGPEQWDMGTWRELWLFPTIVRVVSARRVPLALRAMERMKNAHPSEPHFYLCLLGVLPDQRGRGIGAALIRAGLERCDAARLPAYLESSNELNLPLYRSHGFELLDTLNIGDGAPPLYRMLREPISLREMGAR
jgi:ribosomal protein S18 acetylase RimI-like enzyme